MTTQNDRDISDNGIEEIANEHGQVNSSPPVVHAAFDEESKAISIAHLIREFVKSYSLHKDELPLVEWLSGEFRQYHGLWSSEDELNAAAREVVFTVQQENDAKTSLYRHIGAGRSRESWLANKLEQGAAAKGNIEVGQYAEGIDQVLRSANEEMIRTVNTQFSTINQNSNLDGFIFEQHHVDTFNIDAAAKGKLHRAKVLTPDAGKPYGKNSVDIVICDENGKVVRRYQAKCTADGDAASRSFENGDYRGQRKLVPKEQTQDVKGSTDKLEMDGVQSKPVSKEEMKRLQEKAQRESEIRKYDWNDTNRIVIAKEITKQAIVGAAITAGVQGGRIIGRRIWNFINGKENPPANEDLEEFFKSTLESASNVGVQVAVSGAVVVAAKNGWIPALKHIPAGNIANMVYVAMENVKVLWKLGNGEVSPLEAIDAMANVSCSAIGGLYGAGVGMKAGAAIGTFIAPGVGTVIGGFVGTIAGGMAGGAIFDGIYKGAREIVGAAKNTIQRAFDTVVDFSAKIFKVFA